MQTGPTFSPTLEAALSGFRLVRERPKMLIVWTAVSFLFSLAEGVFAAASCGPAVMRIFTIAEQANPVVAPANADTSVVASLLAQIGPTYVILLAATVAFYALFLTALNRGVFRPMQDRVGYLGLGKEEARQFGLLLMLTLVGLTVYAAMVLVAGVIAAVLAMAGAASAGLLMAIAVVVCGVGYVWLRLSLASPLTFVTGRIDLFGSWALTRGHFWALARVYLLASSLAAAVYLLGLTIIAMGFGAAVGGLAHFATLARPDLSSPAAVLAPPRLVLTLLQSILTALILPVVLCPAMELYRGLGASAIAAPAPSSEPGTPWS
jgi:hypothetical protein